MNFSVVLLLLAVFVFSSDSCGYRPIDWCSSREIAVKCKVVDQCRTFVWNVNHDDEHYWSHEKPVEVGFYYEVLCPDCQNFVKEQLWPTYKAIPDIFHVDFVPYGNAMEYQDGDWWIFQCQHGEEECLGNLFHTCALNMYPLNVTFPFINCMETSGKGSVEKSANECSGQHGLSFSDLVKCTRSDKGNRLEHEMALKTGVLDPPHTYVPWITIDGVHTEDMQDEASRDLLGLICRFYKGVKPSACKREVHRRCLKSL